MGQHKKRDGSDLRMVINKTTLPRPNLGISLLCRRLPSLAISLELGLCSTIYRETKVCAIYLLRDIYVLAPA